ncbi:MAG: hypothetical protein GY792_30470 [Gammaproteobacteria bacterium]|nr:hypothetical protein [Gammaproteobacteria bacterium]
MSKQPDTTIYMDTGAWKIKVALGSVGIVAVVILAFIFRFEAGIIMLGAGTVAVWRGWVWVSHIRKLGDHNIRRMEAETRRLELDTDIVAEKLNQERHKTDEFQLAKFFIETKVGVFRHAPDINEPVYIPASASERKSLPAQIIEAQVQQLDLRHIFTQQQLAYTLIGAQRSGKSYQAMHIADQWLARGVTPLVTGYKKRTGEWAGCKQVISSDPATLEKTLRAIIATGNERNSSQRRDLPPQPVFLDDWMWTVMNVDNADTFFSAAGTVLASANVICYFLMQSDTKDAYGGGRYGAMLKNNLTKLIIEPEPDTSGAIVPGRSVGYLQYANSKERLPISLVSGNPQCINFDTPPPQPVAVPATPPEPEPTPREQVILDMWGEAASLNQISKRLNEGRTGSTYNKEIKSVLRQFGERV